MNKGMPFDECNHDAQTQEGIAMLRSGLLCAENAQGQPCIDAFPDGPFGQTCDMVSQMGCCASTMFQLHSDFFPEAARQEVDAHLSCSTFDFERTCEGVELGLEDGSTGGDFVAPTADPSRESPDPRNACKDHDALLQKDGADQTCEALTSFNWQADDACSSSDIQM